MGDVAIEKWVEEIIRRTVAEHMASCPNVARIQRIEVRFSSLVGFMFGSGTLGGVAGGLLAKLIGV
jgi:hypothetical protein